VTDLEWPYNLPIWQRSLHLGSPDGKMWAKIENAVEVSMGNPTIGTMTTSTGLQVEHCNPSFVWSDDSIYIAVSQYSYSRFWGFGKQRLLIIDVNKNRKWQSPKLAHYIQPESFEREEISFVMNPFKKPMMSNYNISTIKETFKEMPPLPKKRMQSDKPMAGR
jgi:hypothetical protein